MQRTTTSNVMATLPNPREKDIVFNRHITFNVTDESKKVWRVTFYALREVPT